ncbi:PTS sugar transporter subunit IIA [Gottschalkiaceae bacterium SANA]|nr:PTS sugar transporter subunit IIA [Gottschalkiaceae bacterium SANA]
MFILENQNVLLGVDAKNQREAIQILGNQMVENGFIKEAYIDAVIEREMQYPTGLPTEGVKVAIPHANANHVIQSTIGVMTLSKPVTFCSMGDATEELDVELIFLLANTDQSDQPESLQRLMQCFSEEEALLKMKAATTEDEILTVLRDYMKE